MKFERIKKFVLFVSGFLFLMSLFYKIPAYAEKEEKKQEKEKRIKKYLSGSFNVDEGKIGVEKGVIALDVRNREPYGVNSVFYSPVKRLYCFTKIVGAKGKTYVKHVWFLNGKKVATVKLRVNTPIFRTYSYKTLPEGFTGKGKCVVYDDKGFNLATLRFEVREK